MFRFFLQSSSFFLTVSWRWTWWAWWTTITIRWWSAAAWWGTACTFFLFLFRSRRFDSFDWRPTSWLSHCTSDRFLDFILIFLFVILWRRRRWATWGFNLNCFLFVIFVRFSTARRILSAFSRISALFIRPATSFSSPAIPVTWWAWAARWSFARIARPPPACSLCHWLLIEIFCIYFETLWFDKTVLRGCVSGDVWDCSFSNWFWNKPQLRLLKWLKHDQYYLTWVLHWRPTRNLIPSTLTTVILLKSSKLTMRCWTHITYWATNLKYNFNFSNLENPGSNSSSSVLLAPAVLYALHSSGTESRKDFWDMVSPKYIMIIVFNWWELHAHLKFDSRLNKSSKILKGILNHLKSLNNLGFLFMKLLYW